MNNSYSVEAILKATGADQFASDFDRAKKSLGGMEGATKKASGGLKSFMGGVGKIAGAIGVTKLVSAGFNAIRNSVDGAVTRVDTLNQFPKVLTQMGYGADEAQAATDRLSDGIQGLPTRLDEVVSTTQRFVTAFGDVDLATESTLALNNALLASGADAQGAANATDQYVKTMSSGKLEMDTWNTLSEQMSYGLSEVAKDLGFADGNVWDLYDSIQAGDITLEEFNQAMIEASTETGGFAETALTASEGLRTSWSNVQTAIATGVANVIQAINDWMEDAGLGSIASQFDRVKEAVQGAFRYIVEKIPIVLNGVKGLFDTIKNSTAFQTLKDAIQGALDIGQGFIDLFLKSDAFDLFNNKIEMIWEQIKESFSEGNFEQVGEMFSYMFSLIFQKFEEAMPIMLEKGLEVISNIIEGITTKAPELFEKGFEIMVSFFGVITELIPNLISLGWEFIINLIQGITERLPEWIASAKDMVVRMANTIKDNLPTILEKGREMLWKVVDGFKEKFPEVVSAGYEMIKTLAGEILANLPEILDAGVNLLIAVVDGILQTMGDLLSAAGEIVDTVWDTIKEVDWLSIGGDIISGLASGISTAGGALWKAAKGVLGSFKDNVLGFFGIKSPSRVMAKEVGRHIPSGIGLGIDMNEKPMIKSAEHMSRSLMDAVEVPTMDINGTLARSNAQVRTTVSHEINRNQSTTQPLHLNLNIGGQDWRGFVENVSSEQGRITDLELQF